MTTYGPFIFFGFTGDTGEGASWTNPANVIVSDDTYATAALDPVTLGADTTRELRATQPLAGDLPPDALIHSVTITVERHSTGRGTVRDHRVSLIVGGDVQAANMAKSDPWPAVDSTVLYRFMLDPPLTGEDISGFGVCIVARATTDEATARIDAVTLHKARTKPGLLPLLLTLTTRRRRRRRRR
jgi:hypothetical protein